MLFASPKYFWLFLIYIPLIAWYLRKHRRLTASMGMSTVAPLAKAGKSWRATARHGLFVLQMIAIGCLIVVLARPQSTARWRASSDEGTDIVLALDISTSMMARDFEPDRFEAAKEVATKFVNGREHDNMGLVLFAGDSYTAVPMTNDRALLSNYISTLSMNIVHSGMLQDGTAIGDGIATAINRLKSGKAKSKSIILLTDGSNNMGNVAPQTAAEIAAKKGIKVYTIGVGTKGEAPYPSVNAFGQLQYVTMPVTIDEETLENIATTTGGKYFRATDNQVLSDVFDEIDKLEKTEIDVKNFSNTDDDFMVWGWIALICMALSIVLRQTVLRSVP